ncbi:unnamed protein product [Amoebophrya sp. A25]|nr:unnamed protein product [Amoebophrya sp. A25]|eukprot:GSA25T00015704001.1
MNANAASCASDKGHKSDAVTWDEEAIAEHDKERGTRQKIDEPKTPYVGPSTPAPAPVAAMDLAAKLTALSEEQTAAEEKKADFEDKRKKHYNEGLKIKEVMAQAKKEMAQLEENDDEEEIMSEGELAEEMERQRILMENMRKNSARNVIPATGTDTTASTKNESSASTTTEQPSATSKGGGT